jgi:hypothetical protein
MSQGITIEALEREIEEQDQIARSLRDWFAGLGDVSVSLPTSVVHRLEETAEPPPVHATLNLCALRA